MLLRQRPGSNSIIRAHSTLSCRPMLLRLPLHFIDTPCLICFSTPSLTTSCAHHLLVLRQGTKKGCSHYSNTTLPPVDPPSPGSSKASASDAASVAHLYTPHHANHSQFDLTLLSTSVFHHARVVVINHHHPCLILRSRLRASINLSTYTHL